jgi:hypothetical protein
MDAAKLGNRSFLLPQSFIYQRVGAMIACRFRWRQYLLEISLWTRVVEEESLKHNTDIVIRRPFPSSIHLYMIMIHSNARTFE